MGFLRLYLAPAEHSQQVLTMLSYFNLCCTRKCNSHRALRYPSCNWKFLRSRNHYSDYHWGKSNRYIFPLISPILFNGGPLFDVIYISNALHLVVIADRVFAGDEQTINSGNPQHFVDYILSILPISPTSDLGFVVETLGLLSDKNVNKALNLMHPAAFGFFEWINQVNNSAMVSIFADHLYELPCSSR